MTRRTHRRLSLAAFLLLVVLHLDSWRPERDVLWFGWMPEELLWRVLWMAGATLFIAHLTHGVWTDPEERGGERREEEEAP